MENREILNKIKALGASKSDVFRCCRVTFYPTPQGGEEVGSVEVADNLIFKVGGWEASDDFWRPSKVADIAAASAAKRNLDGNDKGRSRARRKVYDLVRCNGDLDTMVTLTLSADKIARDDYEAVIARLRVWLDNRVRRRGLKYFIVPEYHKDGINIHFHGLMNAAALDLVFSGHWSHRKRVYNIADFDLGFTTAVKIGEDENERYKVACYCTKYITKSGDKVGGRYFLHGGNLRRPRVELFNADNEEVVAWLADLHGVQAFEMETPQGVYRKYSIPPQSNLA